MTDNPSSLAEALEECKHWHERQDKALSKSGRADADYYYRRDQHRIDAENIRALSQPEEKETP